MQLIYKRYSKGRDWYTSYEERYRSIVARGVYPKECSSKRARIEDKIGDGNICGM